jgi:hypothetical protein
VRIRFLTAAFPVLALAPLFAFGQVFAFGQTSGLVGDLTPKPPPAEPVKPAPRAVDGKPDLSGLWQRPYVSDMTKSSKDGTQIGMAELPFNEAGQKEWKAYDAAEGDYTGSCLPFGLLRSMNSPDPIQIMQNPGYVALLYEQNTWFHIIPIGKQHHVGAAPTWFGDSIGHWEGDTLVVDTIGMNDRTWLDAAGHPHGEKLKVTEKYTRPDSNTLRLEATMDDPDYYTKPWSVVTTARWAPNQELMEYICQENNRDLQHLVGK